MPRLETTWLEVQSKVKPGDLIVFSGNSFVDRVIKFFTRSTVTHVGVVLDSEHFIDSSYYKGVKIRSLEKTLKRYKYAVLWLPLSEDVQSKINSVDFRKFLGEQAGKRYDLISAMQSALDILDNLPLIGAITRSRASKKKWFCSEIVARSLIIAGVLPKMNTSEITPINICSFRIYTGVYYQLKGSEVTISTYNRFGTHWWKD